MATRKELFEIWKSQRITESIDFGFVILILILLWYIKYKILFWILLSVYAHHGIRWIIKMWKLEKELDILELT